MVQYYDVAIAVVICRTPCYEVELFIRMSFDKIIVMQMSFNERSTVGALRVSAQSLVCGGLDRKSAVCLS